jgi:hypothetical protein
MSTVRVCYDQILGDHILGDQILGDRMDDRFEVHS